MMMIGGAVGFYLGIDTPALAFHPPYGRPSKDGSSGKVDSAEFLSAVGTFLATLTAFVSVIVIVFQTTTSAPSANVAGAIARARA